MKLDTYLIFDIILTGLGVFMVISAFLMKKTGRISKILLTDEEQARIKNTEGFIAFMYPRMLGFAIVCALIGIFGIFHDTVWKIPQWGLIEMTVFLVAFVLFYRWMRQARKDFV